MDILDLLLTGVALSMDAFAVSVSKGLSAGRVKLRHGLIAGAYFGGFQALMPFLGWLLAGIFADAIRSFDHWIAFVLLALIGANMLREAFSRDDESEVNPSFGVRVMLPLAIATSIDALATGVSFALTGTDIYLAIAIIGTTTFLFSAVGVKIGSIFGLRYKRRAEIIGGVILILMGIKILVEHLSGAA